MFTSVIEFNYAEALLTLYTSRTGAVFDEVKIRVR